MNDKIFRKSSIDRVNSPEQLNDYIRVANPSVWIILLAIAVLLVGVVIWGVFGKIETKVDTTVVVENGKAVCYLTSDGFKSVKEGMEVSVEGKDGVVVSIGKNPVEITSDYPAYFLFVSGFNAGDFAYECSLNLSGVDDGVYSASVVVDSINPIYFVIH